jgi:hypothetical protein
VKKARRKSPKRSARAELEALERELDRIYVRIRERARYEWALRQGREKDPSDARVSVRVTATSKPAADSPRRRKPRQRLLLPKRAKPRRKVSRTGRRRLK